MNIWHDMQQCCIKQIHSQNMQGIRTLRSLFQAWSLAAWPGDGQPQAQSHASTCKVEQLGQKPSKATKERRARTARERAATPPVFEQSAAEEKKRKRDNNTDEAIALYKTKTAP